mmetsp:Transcript_15777/g.43556  ORF Transcript_15777/g.43556 Transcript_15777/m.43556 type:complete len:201 (-) Transcript_15777:87-689(-)
MITHGRGRPHLHKLDTIHILVDQRRMLLLDMDIARRLQKVVAFLQLPRHVIALPFHTLDAALHALHLRQHGLVVALDRLQGLQEVLLLLLVLRVIVLRLILHILEQPLVLEQPRFHELLPFFRLLQLLLGNLQLFLQLLQLHAGIDAGRVAVLVVVIRASVMLQTIAHFPDELVAHARFQLRRVLLDLAPHAAAQSGDEG